MRFFPKIVRRLLIPSLILVLCLTGCLPHIAADTQRQIDQTASTMISSDTSSSGSSLTGFPDAQVPFLTEDDLNEKNLGRRFALSGILTESIRANSGSILLTIQTDDFESQVYIRSGLNLDAYSLCIGESYQLEGILDEYKGTFELILEEPDDMIHDGEYNFEEVKVISIIDGDTVRIEMADGTVEKLRIIGVDAPETEKWNQAGEYYADEATDFVSEILMGRTVYLEKDNSDMDKYGRLLRYIWLEMPDEINEDAISELNLSALLLQDGYAAFIRVGDDDKYAAIFSAIDQTASEDQLGMWKQD